MKKPLWGKGSRKKDIDKGKRFCEKPLHGQESEKPYKAEKGTWWKAFTWPRIKILTGREESQVTTKAFERESFYIVLLYQIVNN